MKAILPLFVFVDACGWEIIKDDPFARAFAPNRKRLDSVFGYSSACVPSILSGRWPMEHRNWSYFVYDPKNSPFKSLRSLRWLPSHVTSRRIFRRWLSKFIKHQLNFRGYFDLYNIPFKYTSLYDFTEKKSPLQPRGMNRGANIFDYLQEHHIRWHVSAPERTESANLDALLRDVQTESIDFAFLYCPAWMACCTRWETSLRRFPPNSALMRVGSKNCCRLLTRIIRKFASTCSAITAWPPL